MSEDLNKPQSPREQSLRRTLGYITGDRNAQYGPPTQDFQRTAALWNAFGFRFVAYDGACTCGGAQPLVPHHVSNAQILLKQSRLAHEPYKADSWDDTSGYAACGHECSVEEQSQSKEIPGQLELFYPQPGDVIYHHHGDPTTLYHMHEEDSPTHQRMKPHKHEDGNVIPL